MSETENKKIGQSFIYSFYNETRVLLGAYVNYVNVLAEIGTLTDPRKLEEQSKQILIQALQQLRSSVSVTYIMFESIKDKLKIEKSEELKNLYTKIKNDFVIKSDDAEQYVLVINKIISSEIIQNMLELNQDVINKIYGE